MWVLFNRFRRRERINNKKAYERKLNNFKDYEIGKLKEITDIDNKLDRLRGEIETL